MRKLLILVPILAQCAWHVSHADATETKYWTDSTRELRAKMEEVGYDRPLANTIINACKATAKDPVRCVTVASFIGKAESGAWQAVNSCNNVFGMTGGCYATRTDAVNEWVRKYNRYWYNQRTPDSFYSDTSKRKPKTRYCMSEESSGSHGFCPNWHGHAWNAYVSLTK